MNSKKNWLTEFYKTNFFLSFFFPDACNIQKLTFFQNFCKIPPVKIFFYIFLATSKIDILPKLLSNSAGWIFFYIFLFTISCTHFNFVKRRFLTKIVDLLHPNAPILQDQICHYSPLAIPIPEVPKTTTRVLPDSEWQIWSCSNLVHY